MQFLWFVIRRPQYLRPYTRTLQYLRPQNLRPYTHGPIILDLMFVAMIGDVVDE